MPEWKKNDAWKWFQKLIANFTSDQEAKVKAFDLAWSWVAPDTRPEAWESWMRRCLSQSKRKGVESPVGLLIHLVGKEPDRDLTIEGGVTVPMTNASAYQDFQPNQPEVGAEPGWSVVLSAQIYRHCKDKGEEAAMQAVRDALKAWTHQGRPDLKDFDWKSTLNTIPLSEGEECPF